MFETMGTIDKALLKSMQWHLIAPKVRYVLIGGCIVCPIVTVLMFLNHRADLAFMPFLLSIFFPVLLITTARRNVTGMLNGFQRTYGTQTVTYSTILKSDGIHTYNHAANTYGLISYQEIAQLVETPTAYVLFTANRQFAPVFKDGIENKKEFLAFLKQCPTQIGR